VDLKLQPPVCRLVERDSKFLVHSGLKQELTPSG
jgi:hypothetical protein